jgi:hypothetical protein
MQSQQAVAFPNEPLTVRLVDRRRFNATWIRVLGG